MRGRGPHTFRVRVEFTMESWNNLEMVADEVCHHLRCKYWAKDIRRTVTDLTLRAGTGRRAGGEP